MPQNQNRTIPLIAGALIQFCIGIIYIWGIFQNPVVAYYSWSPSAASMTFSLMLVFFVVGIIGGGRISDIKGPHLSVFLGGLLFTLGIFLTSFVPKELPWLIYLSYSAMAGMGVGFIYTSTIAVAQAWWSDRKGYATGIVVAAFGASSLVFAPLVKYLTNPNVLGLPWTFRFLAILFFVIIMGLSRFIRMPSKETLLAQAPQKEYTPRQIVKTKEFYLCLITMILLTPTFFVINPVLIPFAQERGLSESLALMTAMLSGVMSAGGRLFFPWISDHYGRRRVVLALYALLLFTNIGFIFARESSFVYFVALTAFGFGGTLGVLPAFVTDYFGTKHIGMNYGLVKIGYGFSALLFPFLSTLWSVEGVPSAAFFLLPAGTSMLGFLILKFFSFTKKID